MRMQRSVLYCRILTQEKENSNFPLWQTSWPTLPRVRGLQAECTVWLPHLTLCHSICVSQSHINLHSGLLQWFIGNLSLTTNTGLKLLMTTKLALQRIHQKRQAVIFVHCFPHIDPELCKHAFIKRMLARNVLQLPVRDRGGLLQTPSLPQLLCCQLKYISRTLQNLTCCLFQLCKKGTQPETAFGLSPPDGFLDQRLEMLQVLFPDGQRELGIWSRWG